MNKAGINVVCLWTCHSKSFYQLGFSQLRLYIDCVKRWRIVHTLAPIKRTSNKDHPLMKWDLINFSVVACVMPSKRLEEIGVWVWSPETWCWVKSSQWACHLSLDRCCCSMLTLHSLDHCCSMLTLHSYHKPFYLLAWRHYNVRKVNMRADRRIAFKPPSQILSFTKLMVWMTWILCGW